MNAFIFQRQTWHLAITLTVVLPVQILPGSLKINMGPGLHLLPVPETKAMKNSLYTNIQPKPEKNHWILGYLKFNLSGPQGSGMTRDCLYFILLYIMKLINYESLYNSNFYVILSCSMTRSGEHFDLIVFLHKTLFILLMGFCRCSSGMGSPLRTL